MLKISEKYKIGITEVLVVANLALVLVLVFLAVKTNSNLDNFDSIADPDTYQAVFLTNDQIYFGHLKNISPDYLILSDVFYVKINEGGTGQLVKLGAGEPHGPRDEMIINQDQVLFWENLKPDSQVIKTIQSMQQK